MEIETVRFKPMFLSPTTTEALRAIGDRKPDRAYRCDDSCAIGAHEVWVYRVVAPDWSPMLWLSIKRMDRLPIRDWRTLQIIKNSVVGRQNEAFELFPAEDRKVDTSNQYHLWVFEDSRVRLPFGWAVRAVMSEAEGRDAGARAGLSDLMSRGKQDDRLLGVVDVPFVEQLERPRALAVASATIGCARSNLGAMNIDRREWSSRVDGHELGSFVLGGRPARVILSVEWGARCADDDALGPDSTIVPFNDWRLRLIDDESGEEIVGEKADEALARYDADARAAVAEILGDGCSA